MDLELSCFFFKAVILRFISIIILLMMCQVYRYMNEVLKSAVYCHNTLKRQLLESKYDQVEWALNSATLSQVMVEKNAFKEARHHLAAASKVLELREEDLEVPYLHIQTQLDRYLLTPF